MHKSALLLPLLLAACPGPSTPDDPDAGAPETITLTGTAIDTYVTDAGTTQVPRDLSGETIAAYLDDGVYPGTGHADGTFEIPDFPGIASVKYVRIGHTYVATDASQDLDLGQVVQGRPDQALASAGTTLSLDLTGMTPWRDTDHLELMAPNVGTGGYGAEYFIDTPPEADATSIVSTADWTTLGFPANLIDAAAGDVTTITHLTTADAAVPYTRVSEMVRTDQLTLADGADTAVAGAFVPVPTDQTGQLTVPLTQFAAQAIAGLGVASDGTYATAYLMTRPHADDAGAYGSPATLMQLDENGDPVDVDEAIAYGNPYAGEDVYGGALAYSFGTLDLGGGDSVGVYMTSLREAPAADFLDTTVAPVLGPPTDLQVGAGTTPQIRWTAPALGTATYYRTNIFQLTANGPESSYSIVASFVSTAAGVDVPAGILTAGERYLVAVYAFDNDADVNHRPFVHGFGSQVGVLSGVVAP